MSFFKWFNNHIRESNKKWMNSQGSSLLSSSGISSSQCCANCRWLTNKPGYTGQNGSWENPFGCLYYDFIIRGDIDKQTCENFKRR